MNVPLVLLPGSMTDVRLFDGVLPELRAVAEASVFELPDESTIEEMARRVLADAPDRFALAGLSMGGLVAMDVARQAPERLLGVALLDTNHRPVTDAQIDMWDRFERVLAAGGYAEIIDELVPRFTQRTDRADLIRTMATAVGSERFRRQNRAQSTRNDNVDVLGALDIPALVLCGRDDSVCPVDIHEELASIIPDAKFDVIDDAGHLAPLDQPAAVGRSLATWLSTVANQHEVSTGGDTLESVTQRTTVRRGEVWARMRQRVRREQIHDYE